MSSHASNVFTLAMLDRKQLAKRCDLETLFEQFDVSIAEEMDELAALRDAGHSPIPEVSFGQLRESGFTTEQAQLVRKRGCVVVRNAFTDSQTARWNQMLADYLAGDNQYYQQLEKDINAGDEKRASHPNMLDIYWSQSQIEVRQSAQLQVLQQRLNGLWRVENTGIGSFDPTRSCTYADRIRIRQPLDQMHGLAPHVDSCSMESWFSQQTIEQTYAALFNGDWQSFDAFDAVGRVNTTQKPHAGSVGMFRTYQGWMALTAQGPNCGTLQLVPSSRCVAWMFLTMLRNGINGVDQVYPIPSEAYLLHPEQHALLFKGLCSIPELQAGDTVWWHPDAVHAVEKSNQSTSPSSVIYLGIAPECKRNRDYLQTQMISFKKGLSPPDFPAVHIETNYRDRAKREHLSPLGARQMGFTDTD